MRKKNHILYYFSITMTDLLKACFSDVFEFKFEDKQAIDFFFYMTKYNKEKDERSEGLYTLNQETLKKVLARNAKKLDTPEISILLYYLTIHILEINDDSTREQTYPASKDKVFTLKPVSALLDYCKEKLQLDPSNLKNMTQDSIVDIITICFLTGRHGIPAGQQCLQDLLDLKNESTICQKLEEVKSKFIVIYGDIGDRLSLYMLKYILNQLYGISHHIDFDSYINKTSPEGLHDWLKPKYENMYSQLYTAILNAFLLQKKRHYIIIHDIPSINDLHALITDCSLCKNVIFLCDFYIESPQNIDSVTYLPFKELYIEPCENDIKHYFRKNHITDEYGISNTLITVSKGNIFFLHVLALLVNNLSKSSNPTKIAELKSTLDNLSLEATENTIPTNKFSMYDMDGEKRTGNNIIGHIRRLYKNILSVDEWLLILLIALHDEGLSEEFLLKIFSKNILNIITSLMDKGLINKKQNVYTYEDSPLIPFALAYGKHRIEQEEDLLFSDIFNFLNLMLDEISYCNYKPIDYKVLAVTIRKTCKHTFSLLSKSKCNHQTHFAEIWYYHIRCIRFFLENGDIDSIKELNEKFQNYENAEIKRTNKSLQDLAQKLTSRPGKEYKYWKKLYDIYISFLNVIVEGVIVYSYSSSSYVSIIEKTTNLLKSHGECFLMQPHYKKLILSLIEILINLNLNICIHSIKNCQICHPQNDCYPLIRNIFKINKLAKDIFSSFLYSEDTNFINEITNKFQTTIEITDIYTCNCLDILCNHSAIKEKISDTEPRYIQLSLFRTKCSILYQQCFIVSRTPQYYYHHKTCISRLKAELTTAYKSLNFLPIYILEDYYDSLIAYILFIDVQNTKKMLTYICKDLERYKHIWHCSKVTSILNNILSKFQT